MKLRPSFSLRYFLLFATAVVLFCGYSQLRRREWLRKADEVRALGGEVAMPNGVIDYIWQRRPTKGAVTIGPWADAANVRRADDARSKLEAMGVSDIATLHLY